jgi:hypothetical protein
MPNSNYNPRSWLISLILQIGALVLWMNAAHAGPLAPGGTLFPVPAEPDPIGGTMLSSTTDPFVASTFHGTFTSRVLSGDTSNPFGGLTFVYQINNAPDSRDAIFRMTLDGFGGRSTDASYNLIDAPGGVPPSAVTRSANGQVVGFNFGAPGIELSPGTFSSWLVVQTDSQSFTPSTVSFINGSTTTIGSLAPVPEPSVLALAGLGALGLLAWDWRRRRRNALR